MKQHFYRWLALNRLTRRYEYLMEVNKILEAYTTQLIVEGGSPEFIAQQRQSLITLQNDMKSTERMLTFMKSL